MIDFHIRVMSTLKLSSKSHRWLNLIKKPTRLGPFIASVTWATNEHLDGEASDASGEEDEQNV